MVKLYTILVRKPLNYEQLLKEQKECIYLMIMRKFAKCGKLKK